MRYEDLKTQPAVEVRRIAAFIGMAEVSDELVDKVVAGSSFEAMRNKSGRHEMFYRKGKVGDSAAHFTPSMRAEFDAIIKEQTAGMDDPYSAQMS